MDQSEASSMVPVLLSCMYRQGAAPILFLSLQLLGHSPAVVFIVRVTVRYIKTMSLQGFQNLAIGKIIHMKLLKENSSWKGLGKDFKCCQAEFCA